MAVAWKLFGDESIPGRTSLQLRLTPCLGFTYKLHSTSGPDRHEAGTRPHLVDVVFGDLSEVSQNLKLCLLEPEWNLMVTGR